MPDKFMRQTIVNPANAVYCRHQSEQHRCRFIEERKGCRHYCKVDERELVKDNGYDIRRSVACLDEAIPQLKI